MATIAEKLAELGITDSFNRIENPLGGEWKLLKPGVTTGEVRTGGKVEGGYTPKSTFVTGEDDAYWSKTVLSAATAHVAALLQITRLPTTTERQIGLWILRSSVAPETTQSGYRLRVEFLGGKKLKFVLEKWVAGVMSELKKVESEAYGVGSRVAIVSNGATVYFFASKEEKSAFEEVASVADAAYSEGYSGIYGKGTGEFRGFNFATGSFELGEVAGIHKPNAATATASRPEPALVSGVEWGAATATASMPSAEAANGAMPSPTNDQRHGLPLPYPSVLANPGRLGPSRFTSAERKTLRLKR